MMTMTIIQMVIVRVENRRWFIWASRFYFLMLTEGVLNTEYSESRCDGCIGIDGDKVHRLNQIVSATGAKIVLSSTWRLGYTRYGQKLPHHMKYLKRKLRKEGLTIYSVTPELSRTGDSRGIEIHTWLEEHRDENIVSWVVLDDEWFYDFGQYDIRNHLVDTNYYVPNGGLTDEDVKKAIQILNGGIENE